MAKERSKLDLLAVLLMAISFRVSANAYIDGFLSQSKMFNELNDEVPLGHNLIKYFKFDPQLTYVNHGSYGSATKIAFDDLKYWEERMEMDLDRWFRFEANGQITRAKEVLTDYIGATSTKDIGFVPNASGGVNAVLRSLKFGKNDVILYLDTAYGMVKRTLQFLIDYYGVQVVEVKVKFPFATHELLWDLETAIKSIPKNQSIKLSIFSHISSVPALILPVAELTELCHKFNIPVLIDGAHAPGQITLNVTKIGAEFYVGNGHKWVSTPKSVGFLWVQRSFQSLIHPTVISWQYKQGFAEEFDHIGTYDYCTWLSFAAAIEIRKKLGENRLLNYTRGLAKRAIEIVSKIWDTQPLSIPEQFVGNMINVRFPTQNFALAQKIADRLIIQYNTYVPVYKQDDVLYARISCQIYNEDSDYVYVANAVKTLVETMQ